MIVPDRSLRMLASGLEGNVVWLTRFLGHGPKYHVPGDHAIFEVGDQEVQLDEGPSSNWLFYYQAFGNPHHVYWRVDDMDRYLGLAHELGAKEQVAHREDNGGMRTVTIQAPSGLTLPLVYNPPDSYAGGLNAEIFERIRRREAGLPPSGADSVLTKPIVLKLDGSMSLEPEKRETEVPGPAEYELHERAFAVILFEDGKLDPSLIGDAREDTPEVDISRDPYPPSWEAFRMLEVRPGLKAVFYCIGVHLDDANYTFQNKYECFIDRSMLYRLSEQAEERMENYCFYGYLLYPDPEEYLEVTNKFVNGREEFYEINDGFGTHWVEENGEQTEHEEAAILHQLEELLEDRYPGGLPDGKAAKALLDEVSAPYRAVAVIRRELGVEPEEIQALLDRAEAGEGEELWRRDWD